MKLIVEGSRYRSLDPKFVAGHAHTRMGAETDDPTNDPPLPGDCDDDVGGGTGNSEGGGEGDNDGGGGGNGGESGAAHFLTAAPKAPSISLPAPVVPTQEATAASGDLHNGRAKRRRRDGEGGDEHSNAAANAAAAPAAAHSADVGDHACHQDEIDYGEDACPASLGPSSIHSQSTRQPPSPPPPSVWTCGRCTFAENPFGLSRCSLCDGPAPYAPKRRGSQPRGSNYSSSSSSSSSSIRSLGSLGLLWPPSEAKPAEKRKAPPSAKKNASGPNTQGRR